MKYAITDPERVSMSEQNKSKNTVVFSSLIWRLAERIGAQGVTFVVSIVLARILYPSAYGIVALVSVFTSILQVFVDGGMGTALVQKKDADELDFSTVFIFNMAMCFFLYLVMFFCAPAIAAFYDKPELVLLVRVLSSILIISGVKSIQQAYISKHMLFKKFFFATLLGTIISAVVGIVMALMGLGVWAIVAQNLTNKLIDTIVLWYTVKWRPKMQFSLERFWGLFSYGWKILAANLVNTAYNNIRALVIGKKYSPEDLAYFNKGEQLPSLIVMNVNTSIDSVLLSAMSKEQDNNSRVKAMTRRSIRVGTYILAPIMIGFAACARSFVGLILTDKWLPSVEFLQIICIAYMFQPIQTANMNAIKALGRSDIYLKLDILKKFIGLVLLIISMFFGVKAITFSVLIVAIIFQFVNTIPNKRLLDYGYNEQIKDIFPSILLAMVMGVLVYYIGSFGFSYGVTLLLQIPAGIAIYIFASLFFKIDSFNYLLSILNQYRRKTKKSREHEGKDK